MTWNLKPGRSLVDGCGCKAEWTVAVLGLVNMNMWSWLTHNAYFFCPLSSSPSNLHSKHISLCFTFSVLTFFFFFQSLFCPLLCPTHTLHYTLSSSVHNSLLSGCSRGVSHLLAALLCDSHSEHPLQDMLRASWVVQCFHLAGVCQQCPKPCYLHHLQHRVQTGLHQDPQLLRKDACQKIKMEMSLCTTPALDTDHRFTLEMIWSKPTLCPTGVKQ